MPQRIYKDPFRGGDNIIVMADTYEPPRLQSDGSLSELKVQLCCRLTKSAYGRSAATLAPWLQTDTGWVCGRLYVV